MSSGIVVCSVCQREVHQDGPVTSCGMASWRHCEDKSPLCADATTLYPASKADIVGPYCGCDEPPPTREDMTRAERRRETRDFLKRRYR